MGDRVVRLTGLLGTNGTGKSTVLKKMATASLNRGDRVLVVPANNIDDTWDGIKEIGLDQINNFKSGIRKVNVMCYEEFQKIADAEEGFFNGTLILDDMKNYIQGQQLKPDVARMLGDRRHKMIDIIFAVHGFNFVPPLMFSYVSEIFLFKTFGKISNAKECWNDYEGLLKWREYVNKIAAKDPYYFRILKNS
jgi:energy-coupling factor transporter ATP-binding protein EcfA2